MNAYTAIQTLESADDHTFAARFDQAEKTRQDKLNIIADNDPKEREYAMRAVGAILPGPFGWNRYALMMTGEVRIARWRSDEKVIAKAVKAGFAVFE
jgi:hypothetical protein